MLQHKPPSFSGRILMWLTTSVVDSGHEFETRLVGTAQPQAVNADFDVFSGNRRDVLTLNWSPKGDAGPSIPVAFVAIGAMLVGSIGWTNANQGSTIQRGDESGYFAYGGSTVVVVFPPEAKVQWDKDLLDNSLNKLETMVRVGDRIGISTA